MPLFYEHFQHWDKSHQLQNSINFLLLENVGSDWMIHHSGLEFLQIHHLVFVNVCLVEHLCHCLGEVNLSQLSVFGNKLYLSLQLTL